jgi:hypothetical protein
MSLRSLVITAIVCAGTLVRADRIPPMPPMPPMPPGPPAPLAPPPPGISVSVRDGGVSVDGLGTYVDQSIDRALRSLDQPGVPERVREKMRVRLEALRGKLRRQLRHLDARDVEQLGAELGRIGEEIGQEFEPFGEDMGRLGQQLYKDVDRTIPRQWRYHAGQPRHHAHDHDSDDDDDDDVGASPSNGDGDDDDVDDVARGLGNLSLQREQREQIVRLREDSERRVADAKQALATAERELHDLLDNPGSSDADISRAVDAVSQQEAAIRKARILAWHGARRVLDDDQRRRIEDAVHGHGK